MRCIAALVLGGLGSVVFSGCSEGTPEPAVTPSVLAGLPTWTAVPELRIGSIDDPEQALTPTRTNLISEGADGRLFVGQPQDGNVRIYDAAGNLVSVFGSRGEGPGEFGLMMTLGVTDSAIYVSDISHSDVEVFDQDGRHLRTQTYREPPAGESRALAPQQLLPGGAGIVSPGRDISVDGEFVHLLVDATGALIDTIFSYSTNRVGIPLRTGDRFAAVRTPFGGPPPFVASPSGEFYWAVGDESEAEYRLDKVTLAGDTLLSRSFAVEPVPIPAEARDSARVVAVEQASEWVSSSNRAGALIEDLVPIPTHYRAAVGARVDPTGGIWVALPPARTSQYQDWVLHRPSGEPRAVLRLPIDVEVALVSEDRVWAIEHDELEVPYVVRFRVVPAA